LKVVGIFSVNYYKKSMKASAIANTNIVLVKYWGKRNERLILLNNDSISLTLDSLNYEKA